MFFDIIIWSIFWFWLAKKVYRRFVPVPLVSPQGKWVFVTGCDTGFGNMLAKQLDKKGYNVFAACLTEAGCKELASQCSERVVPIKLDITKEDEIAAAVKVVQSNTDRLHALVNNAGIALGSLVEWTSLAQYRKVMEVNCFGGIACTKALLPFLIKKNPDGSKARVVNITSVAGLIAADGLSAYCCSKYAFEAFSDSLRRELYTWGVHVSIVEPGFMKTPIVMNARANLIKLWEEVPQDVKKRYGQDYFDDSIRIMDTVEGVVEDPQIVVNDLLNAVGSTKPEIRYKPGVQASYVLSPLALIPAWITDLVMRQLRGRQRQVKPAYLREERKSE